MRGVFLVMRVNTMIEVLAGRSFLNKRAASTD
jgi:hypothetical protein